MASIDTKIVPKSLIIGNQGKYLILRRSQNDQRFSGEWDFAGGKLENGESIEEGLAREITEETGLVVANNMLRFVRCHYFKEQKSNYISMIYISSTDSDNVTLSHEHDSYKWVERSELLEYFKLNKSGAHVEAISYILDNNLDN